MNITEEMLEQMSEEELNALLEDIEQLDEVSKDTLRNYKTKSLKNMVHHDDWRDWHENEYLKNSKKNKKTADIHGDMADQHQKRFDRRSKGLDAAQRKLAEESLSEEDYKDGAKIPEPVNTGDVHANRKADQNVGDKTRADYYQEVMAKISALPTDVLAHICKDLYDDAHDNEDYSEANRKTITVKEDVADLFEGQELSEEFKSKATQLFEAAVLLRLDVERQALQEEYELALEEKMEEIEDAVDLYLTNVVEEWLEENALQIEEGLEAELNQNLVSDIKAVLESYNIDISEDTLSLASELESKVEELEEKLNEEKLEKIELAKEVEVLHKALVLEDLVRGLPLTKQEKFKSLCESFSDYGVEEFESQANVLLEQFTKTKEVEMLVEEKEPSAIQDVNVKETSETIIDPTVKRYADAAKRLKQ